jgi:hypothetical protein
MRACAEKSLESATKYGKVDLRPAARAAVFVAHFRLTVVLSRIAKFSLARRIGGMRAGVEKVLNRPQNLIRY